MEVLYIARHGQTEWNMAHRIQGQYNPPLSRNGFRQRRALFYALKDQPIACIYTSELERTILTAKPISDHLGISLHPTCDLNEISFGLIEGEIYTDLDDWGLNTWNWWLDDPVHRRIPGGGESYSDVLARVDSFLDHLGRQKLEGHVLIVGHFRINQMLLSRLKEVPINKGISIQQENNWLYRLDPNSDLWRAEVSYREMNAPEWEKGLLFSPDGCGPRPQKTKPKDI